ncbi:MAG: 2TM domain-containing protein [Myxococcales bacterium]|nr:2TM domain-containing protein [Myxococcales bacterium]
MDEIQRAQIEKKIRAKAVRKVGARLGFMWHAGLFAMCNIAMLAINLNYSPETLWFVWPLAAWGAALLMHAFATFSAPGMTEDMIQAEIQREMARRGLA